MKEQIILKTENLRKEYNQGSNNLVVLQNICLEIYAGELAVINGESGSGKSTLLNLLAGLDDPTSGQVIIDDKTITDLNESQMALFRRKKIGFIFQQYHLLPELSAVENVMLPLLINGKMKKEAFDKAASLLNYVGLEERLTHQPAQLSGGQCQRVAIARALITDPKIIFADEPTGNLDSKNKERVLETLSKINKEKGSTILMVTHSQQDINIASRVIRIKDGVVE